jgi:hypothetical protein
MTTNDRQPPSRLLWFSMGFLTAAIASVLLIGLTGFGLLVRDVFVHRSNGPGASQGALEAALHGDLQTVRSQIELYKVQHLEKTPELDENGRPDTANFAFRLTGRTDQDGRLSPAGALGPYLQRIPANPFTDEAVARKVAFGQGPPPGDGAMGWWFDTASGTFYANDPDHTGL